jgi:hypothetical protein
MTFLNIFSKKIKGKEKMKQQTKIIVDHREKNAIVTAELIKEGFEIEFAQLAVADYLINDIAIERKTITDLKCLTQIATKELSMRMLFEVFCSQRFSIIKSQ